MGKIDHKNSKGGMTAMGLRSIDGTYLLDKWREAA